MRITKALEYGATWQKEWNDSVTHAVVDKSMNYDQMLRFLKVKAMSVSTYLYLRRLLVLIRQGQHRSGR